MANDVNQGSSHELAFLPRTLGCTFSFSFAQFVSDICNSCCCRRLLSLRFDTTFVRLLLFLVAVRLEYRTRLTAIVVPLYVVVVAVVIVVAVPAAATVAAAFKHSLDRGRLVPGRCCFCFACCCFCQSRCRCNVT